MSLYDVNLCENSPMLTVQASQQHRLVVMQPKKVKSFPAATVRWYTAAAENVGPEARRAEMFGGHTRVSNSVDDREVEAYCECCTQHIGRIKSRTRLCFVTIWVKNPTLCVAAHFWRATHVVSWEG